MIPVSALVTFIVYIVCIGLIFFLLWWLIDYVGLPEPFHKVAKVILAVFAVLILISLLMSLAGQPLVRW